MRSPERHAVGASERKSLPPGQDLKAHDAPEDPSVSQEVWDTLKEEFYEQIEQLPLSLHRSFALIREQDAEVEACRGELLPTIRSYVRLRQSLLLDPSRPKSVQDSHEGDRVSPRPGGDGPDLEIAVSGPNTIASHAGQPIDTSLGSHFKPEDDISLQESFAPVQEISTVPDTSSSPLDDCSVQPTWPRTQGIRETDASVPKSVPFPPRPKPKASRGLLTRIAFLMGEVVRASEEKVGLASAAYDLVDRHVRVLDMLIKDHEPTAAPGLREGILPVGAIGSELIVPTTNISAENGPDEHRLGLTSLVGVNSINTRKGKKLDRRNKRPSRSPVSRVNAFPSRKNHELPMEEPRYCYCYQYSYGEMIACDSPDCSREWFHLGCVGLTAPPRNNAKWFCKECEEMRRIKRRKVR